MLNRIKYQRLPSRLRKRWTYEDFLGYRMQEMNIDKIELLATEEELWGREKQLNDDGFRQIFNDKREFYKRFNKMTNGKYIKRAVMFLENASLEEFEEFRNKHKKIVVKPPDMYAGIGITVLEGEDADFDDLKKKHYIAEEYIVQASEYSDIYPLSLNTIRVTTFIDEGGIPQILFAVNQFGQKGSLVDNDDDAAIWAAIDTVTGIVKYAEVDGETGAVYDIHPDSGKPILGFANPVWSSITELALELARVVPECRLVGWDIAVRADYSLEVIEGNVTPELDLYQRISGEGLRKIM